MKNVRLMLFGIAVLIASFLMLIPKEVYDNITGFKSVIWGGLIICGTVFIVIGMFKKI